MLGSVPRTDKVRVMKWRRYAALAGVILALVCKSLPPDYQAVCEVIASLCSF